LARAFCRRSTITDARHVAGSVLPVDPARRRIIFANPSATASIASAVRSDPRRRRLHMCRERRGLHHPQTLRQFRPRRGTPQGPRSRWARRGSASRPQAPQQQFSSSSNARRARRLTYPQTLKARTDGRPARRAGTREANGIDQGRGADRLPDGLWLPQPRTLEQAAKDCGYRIKRARNYLDALPAFNEYRRRLLKERARASKRATSQR